jgi:hypothetical protein
MQQPTCYMFHASAASLPVPNPPPIV